MIPKLLLALFLFSAFPAPPDKGVPGEVRVYIYREGRWDMIGHTYPVEPK